MEMASHKANYILLVKTFILEHNDPILIEHR